MGSRRDVQSALAPALRRTDGVRLLVGGGPLRAQAFGIGHRFPATVPISVRLAASLIEAGAPCFTVAKPVPTTEVGRP